MKIKAAPLSRGQLAAPLSRYSVRATKNGVVVQRKPVPGTRKFSTLQRQYQQRFAFAAIMASNPFPTDLATAIEMAKGTEQVPRDILTMAAMGQYYLLVGPDGQQWGNVQGPIVP